MQFFKIIMLRLEILYTNTSISKILVAGLEPATIRLYFHDFRLYGYALTPSPL